LCIRLKLVQLDVTDEKQVADAYDFVESHVGTEGTWNCISFSHSATQYMNWKGRS